MKVSRSKASHQRSHWLQQPIFGGLARAWLLDKGSLTKKLKQHFNHFSVIMVRLQYAKPLNDEVALLQHSPNQRALIREVLLMGNQHAVVFAHSVLPKKSLRGPWRGLGHLGNKPLGGALFANPIVKRTPLSYKKLGKHHALYGLAAQHFAYKPAYLWARRSVFSLNCANIVVTEIFLPELFIP